MANFDTINAHLLINLQSYVQQWIPGGQQHGKEYVVRNPLRPDKTAHSFTINIQTGVWKDFAEEGAAGKNPISLYAYLNRLEYKTAADELAAKYNVGEAVNTYKSVQPISAWVTVAPVPSHAPAPPAVFMRKVDGRWCEYQIVDRWEYRDSDGGLNGYDVKIIQDGSKQILPLTYCKNKSGGYAWRFLSFKSKRPLYGMDRVAKQPDAIVIIVEGCKCARALQTLLDSMHNTDFIVVTWPGGCASTKYAKWSLLKGRAVYIWPDNDHKLCDDKHVNAGQEKPKDEQPGYMAALSICKELDGVAPLVKIIDVPGSDKPDTWDVADAIYNDKLTLDQIVALINDRLIDPPSTKQKVGHDK